LVRYAGVDPEGGHDDRSAGSGGCAIIFSGQIDQVGITELQITLECSNDLTTLQAKAPRENMHTGCRHQFYDDLLHGDAVPAGELPGEDLRQRKHHDAGEERGFD